MALRKVEFVLNWTEKSKLGKRVSREIDWMCELDCINFWVGMESASSEENM